MLPQRHRLTHTKDFAHVRRFGRSSGSTLLALYVLRSHLPDTRVGFSVSKRVGKATIRNRVKRRMREAVRHQLTAIPSGYDLVFIARPASALASYEEIAETVEYLLRKTGTVRESVGTAGHA